MNNFGEKLGKKHCDHAFRRFKETKIPFDRQSLSGQKVQVAL